MKLFVFAFLFSTALSAQEMGDIPQALQGIPDPNQPIFVEEEKTEAQIEKTAKKSSFHDTLDVIKKLEAKPRALASEKEEL